VREVDALRAMVAELYVRVRMLELDNEELRSGQHLGQLQPRKARPR